MQVHAQELAEGRPLSYSKAWGWEGSLPSEAAPLPLPLRLCAPTSRCLPNPVVSSPCSAQCPGGSRDRTLPQSWTWLGVRHCWALLLPPPLPAASGASWREGADSFPGLHPSPHPFHLMQPHCSADTPLPTPGFPGWPGGGCPTHSTPSYPQSACNPLRSHADSVGYTPHVLPRHATLGNLEEFAC